MKAQFQKILINQESSFLAKELNLSRFDNEFHFHPEYELKYVCQSRGIRFIGDSVENFTEGDLVLLGPNIPHYWNNDANSSGGKANRAKAFLVMFSEDFLGKDFFSLPEMASLKILLNKSKGGICFPNAVKLGIPGKLRRLVSCTGPLKLMIFLDILNDLTHAEIRPLLTKTFVAELPLTSYSDHSVERLKKVYEFVLANYQNKIHIKEVADIANMSTFAFCKYFKKSTIKTFMTFLVELRICHAKKLLIQKDELAISDICFDSGFDNLSNFNRQFKLITSMTPKEYRRHYERLS
jgi:AraC-like DNA-binding protein